ncbi:unnamed protein product [Tuber aestivum]|uniref:Uncharacterized protein n=1 Tax=Tuber aestivum TaxID=59557 RepID=A0A292Q8X1_9PEZI|nr:unnamed protein product [Tuber aestivum]
MSSSESSTLSADLIFEFALAAQVSLAALVALVFADFGAFTVAPLALGVAAFFGPFLPIIPFCELDLLIDSSPLGFFPVSETCDGSVASPITFMLGGGTGFAGLVDCGAGGHGSTFPLSSGASVFCHSGASRGNRSLLKAALQFDMAASRFACDGYGNSQISRSL